MPETNDDIWAEAEAELALWRAAGQTARFWLRDDDATDVTAALRRFLDLAAEHHVPTTLAIIPALMTDNLAAFVRYDPSIFPATHGLHHRNHAGPNEKKIELGGDRTVDAVLADLELSRQSMSEAFGLRVPDMLVPPWNRISAPVTERLETLGFDVLSTFGWKPGSGTIRQLNTHVDLIDWKAGKQGKSVAMLAREIAASLEAARHQGFAPVGILTHHLAHDETAWASLAAVLEWAAARPGIGWHAPTDLLAG